ncbi:AMP-binding protein [Pseudochryseolinea flava]|uniref:CoF synthetase n=1 Tax=Pseudochryseolinea flava TaxID=2059302 RepID=A0A364Y114_9BACT|nr:AMP-binding protein [Pseudochryseolinea flava]RAW00365.1 CoF synthetase [Pseudochryseolinea flava]
MDASKKPTVALTDEERFPLINDLFYLKQMQQDDTAPKFNFQSGDRLRSEQLAHVKSYASKIKTKQFWNTDSQPSWMSEYLNWCTSTVPFYTNRSNVLTSHPTIRRRDIHDSPWQFVSADCDLKDLLVYQTSGTTGAAMDVVFDPISQACWIPQLESLLQPLGIRLSRSNRHVAIALICDQQTTITYASLSTYLDGAGVLKINLNPSEWKRDDDRRDFLEKYNPEVLTGDPFAFNSLLALQPNIRPKAMVSSAMKLTNDLRQKLESYFDCPVLDIYSLTECRMVAVADGDGRHRAIRPELYFEIFHPQEDVLMPPGERGELVITGGNNPFLPLIRYRTGDFCSMTIDNGTPYLVDLEARLPIAYYRSDGSFINNIDISRAMTDFPLVGFSIHQQIDKHVTFKGWCSTLDERMSEKIRATLEDLFGENISVKVSCTRETPTTKPVSFTSDIG